VIIIKNKNVKIDVSINESDDGIRLDFRNEHNQAIPDSPQMMIELWDFPNKEDNKSFNELMDFLKKKEEKYGIEYYTEELERDGIYKLINGELERTGFN
jgi:hypothetical protein